MIAVNFFIQQLEHTMVAILAAASAIDPVDKVATGAMALWKQLSTVKADAKKDATGASDSFDDVLTSHEATNSGSASGTSAVGTTTHGHAGLSAGQVGAQASGHGRAHHTVDQLA